MSSAIANRNIAVEDLPKYSVADWAQWEGKWELIEGIPYAMSPMPGKKHQRLNGRLYSLFSDALTHCPDCEAYLPVNFKSGNHNLLYPDLLVVCGEEEEGTYVTITPHLIVEILARSTRKKDEETKPKVYKAIQVQYYIIGDPKTEIIRIFELQSNVYQLMLQEKAISYDFNLGAYAVMVDFGRIWRR